jgi:hypothetical protein
MASSEKKNPQQKKRNSSRNFLLLKLNTKPLKFKCGLADGGGGMDWSTHVRHGYPHLLNIKTDLKLAQVFK